MAGFLGATVAGSWNMGRGIIGSRAVQGAGRYAAGGVGKFLGGQTSKRAAGNTMRNFGLGKGMSGWGRALGIGFLGFEAISGYQREGAWGAAKGVGSAALWSYGIEIALGSAALPIGIAAGVAVGGVMLNKAAAEKGRAYGRSHRELEFGAAVSDQFGTVSTMRRRSVMALNQSRIGGNMGMGNEAMRQYQPYFR